MCTLYFSLPEAPFKRTSRVLKKEISRATRDVTKRSRLYYTGEAARFVEKWCSTSAKSEDTKCDVYMWWFVRSCLLHNYYDFLLYRLLPARSAWSQIANDEINDETCGMNPWKWKSSVVSTRRRVAFEFRARRACLLVVRASRRNVALVFFEDANKERPVASKERRRWRARWCWHPRRRRRRPYGKWTTSGIWLETRPSPRFT